MSSGTAPRRKKAAAKRSHPAFFRISDEMRRICVLLGAELESFPEVTSKPMFGFLGYYRDGMIFAALPKTKALGSPNSVIFKLNAAPKKVFDRADKDPSIKLSSHGMKGWHSLEIASELDIAHAQYWLVEAWRYAVKVKSKN